MSCGLILGMVPKLPMVFVCRFFEGLFSAMPAVVAASSLENLWDLRARVWVRKLPTRVPLSTSLTTSRQVFQIWTSISVVGLSCGPLVGTVVGASLGW
jgi:MFS family permease